MWIEKMIVHVNCVNIHRHRAITELTAAATAEAQAEAAEWKYYIGLRVVLLYTRSSSNMRIGRGRFSIIQQTHIYYK